MFDRVRWRDAEDALGRLGLDVALERLHEISRNDAEQTLAAALERDLCYRAKVMSPGKATSVVGEFMEHLHPQSRFFTNSSTPYHRAGTSFSFSSFSNGTVDTGVIVKTAKELGGVFWITDSD